MISNMCAYACVLYECKCMYVYIVLDDQPTDSNRHADVNIRQDDVKEERQDKVCMLVYVVHIHMCILNTCVFVNVDYML